jgi:PIN domain nuclease of toxin-antitoxin system
LAGGVALMLLLDTHAMVWLASDLTKLPRTARDTIRAHAGELLISGISGLEIALAVKRRRLKLPVSPDEFMVVSLKQHGIREIPVSATLGCLAARLPDIHNDPFDRIIIATAQQHRAKILSKDTLMARYPDLEVVW